ncbi:MAG TPA: SRPBCC family protein [Acidimicrobiales bacterium]|nr:SRPBCC family protein [Acidimicrobiales bacterium]
MADHTTERMVISGTPERCFAVVTDLESYPEWVADLKSVQILERDAEGRASRVAFRAAAFGRSTSYTLEYDYTQAPSSISWVQTDGDLTTRLDGRYVFTPAGDGETEVAYELSVDLRVPIPGFVKRRAEGHILHAAIRDLKSRVESGK